MYLIRIHIPLLMLLLSMISGTILAQDISIDREESRLWIEGSSNVNNFRCNAGRYQSQVDPPTSDTTVKVEVDVAVEGFDCGKRRMNRDLYETLRSKRHPQISFQYVSTESMTYVDESDKYELIVNGRLTVAGHTNDIQFPLDAVIYEDGTIRATGSTVLKMTDYNVEPPSALLGLVRVDDELTVYFELFASMNNFELASDGQDQQ